MWPADARAFSRPTFKAREKRPGDGVNNNNNNNNNVFIKKHPIKLHIWCYSKNIYRQKKITMTKMNEKIKLIKKYIWGIYTATLYLKINLLKKLWNVQC